MSGGRRHRPVEPWLAALRVRYSDLETTNFLGRVVSSIHKHEHTEGWGAEINGAIRRRCKGLRPDAFRIVPGPHEGWRDDVHKVVAYLCTPDGLIPPVIVPRWVQMWWECDATETHTLDIVMVDAAGQETPLDTQSLALGYDRVHYERHSR